MATATTTQVREAETGARLRTAVAEFFGVDEGEVGPNFSLQGRRGQGSIARAALDSLIRRRLGIASRAVYSARTYGELAAELAPGATPVAPETSPAALPVNGQDVAPVAGGMGVRCGIDIELIDHLPRVPDCWEDPFYRDHFTPAEIAYCQLQETPAPHFAARWCAKEALKKCDGAFLATAMNEIEVVADEAGAPTLVHHASGQARRLPHAVSLSHTPHAAVAVVVKVDAPAPLPPTGPAALPPIAVTSAPPDPRRRGGLMPTLLGLVAVALALLALLRTFWIAK